MDLTATRELELHLFLVLQLGADGHYDLANVDAGYCTLALSKGTTHPCLEPRLRTACQTRMSPGKGSLQMAIDSSILLCVCVSIKLYFSNLFTF